MPLLEIANEDLKVAFSNSAGPSDTLYTGDVGIDAAKVVPTKSTKCKATSKSICTTAITLLFAVGGNECPHTSVTYNFVAGGGTIAATAVKTKADSQFVLRKGDSGTCAGTWQMIASPYTVVPCACSVEISDAGQTKAKAQ